jgi:hypothetical protein
VLQASRHQATCGAGPRYSGGRDRDPPACVPDRVGAKRKYDATFGTESILLPPPIDFPREPIEEALAEHARLLRAHAHDIMHAVTDDEGVADGMPFVGVDDCVAVVVAHGDITTSGRGRGRMHRRVFRRCHGIVRKLCEAPRCERFYAIVIAGGVASMHVMTGTGVHRVWHPDVRYTREGLGVKVVTRNVIAEPWEQWHRRDRGRMLTYWSLPCGAQERAG